MGCDHIASGFRLKRFLESRVFEAPGNANVTTNGQAIALIGRNQAATTVLIEFCAQ